MDILTYILSKRYIEDSLKGAGALKGKSAYEIACDNGFNGSPEEWLDSLKGETPRISDDGTWVIGEVDTGILASPDLFGYATEDYVDKSVKVVGEALAKKVDKGDAIPVPAIAAVGQTVMVKAVDENGKPTEWEVVDKPVYIANVRVDRDRYSFIDGSYETLLNAYNSGATVGLNVDSYMYYLHHIDGDNNLHFGQIPHRSIGSDHSTPNYNLMIAPDNSFTQIQMDIATEQFVRNELEKIEVSGGGSGGVSSWNDLTDKPFYDANGSEKILPDRLPDGGVGWEGPGGKTDILPESNLVVDENTQTTPMPDGRILYGYLFLSPTIKADLTEGAEYDIAINGVVYRRVCTAPGGSDDPIHGLGNLALGEMGEDTGEDWLFYAYAGEPGFFVGVFATTNAEYKTVAVSAEGTLIHPIEDRFIPASVARKGDVNWQAIPDKPFGVTVVNLASPMTLAEMRYDGSYTAGLGFLPQRIAAGERYLVSVDGEITEWVAQQGDSGVYLGEDPRAFNEADTLPEGAYSIWQTSNSILVYLLGDRTAPIIGVAHVEIKYIDERVIPEGIARKTDIPVIPVTSVNGMTGDVVIETELDTTLTVEGKAADAKAVGDAISKISGQNLALDTTLTQSGEAADAKAVGDALDELEEKIPTKPEDIGAQPKGDYVSPDDIPKVPDWAMQASKPAYTASEVGALPNTYTPPNQTAEQVGADPTGTAVSAVSAHNTNNAAHNDIRQELAAINARLTAFFDSDNQTLDELSEIVAYITSNKSLIDGITTSKVSVADIVNNLTTNVVNKPLSAAQGVAIKALIDGLSTGKLDASKLTEAISTALAQAKASGEFDGAKGDPGRGIKSIARTSGNGAAGTTDIYTITYTDNTTSTFTVSNGANGAPGYTPQEGIDYWTPADQEAIVQQVIDALGTPVFGRVDEDCKIALTGELVDGKTYTFAFVDEDGGETVIGTYTKNNAPDYTNQIAISTDADGNVYNGTGYKVGYRLNSNGEEDQLPTTATNPAFITGFIPIKTGDVVLMKDCYIDTNNNDKTSKYGKPNWSLYTSYFTSDRAHKIKTEWNNMLTSKFVTDLVLDAGGYCTGFTFTGEIGSNSIAYIRLCLAGTPETAVVTINEAIE